MQDVIERLMKRREGLFAEIARIDGAVAALRGRAPVVEKPKRRTKRIRTVDRVDDHVRGLIVAEMQAAGKREGATVARRLASEYGLNPVTIVGRWRRWQDEMGQNGTSASASVSVQ